MSGHSKWSTIKRKKELTDNKRANIFSKIAKEIAVAVKLGGEDVNSNSRLKDVITKARKNNMPNDNIKNTIKKAVGNMQNINYEEITYEGFGPFNTAFIIETLTDNKNRTIADIKHIFTKNCGNIGQTGCTSYLFDHLGNIVIENFNIDIDKLSDEAISNFAEDIIINEDCIEILINITNFSKAKEYFDNTKYNIISEEIEYRAKSDIDLNEEQKQKLIDFINNLEDNNDIQNIYYNSNI